MQPNRVIIKQFRSIRELELKFEPSCLILLGINETGKTNILRALSLLSPTASIADDDVRQVASEEPEAQESSVEFFFPVGPIAQAGIVEEYARRTIGPAEAPIAKFDGEELNSQDLVRRYGTEVLYYIDVLKKRRFPRYWTLKAQLAACGQWLTPTDKCPAAHQMTHQKIGEIRARDYWLIHKDELPPGQPETYFRPLADKDIAEQLGMALTTYLSSNLPECIYWSFANDNVLPASVNLDEFLKDPNSWPSLRNMFNLAKLSNPTEAVKSARKRSNGLRTLLERVGDCTTSYIQSVWNDFSALKIELHENGANLECVIRDVYGAYNFSRRSDGFRRFVGFLLQVSSRMAAEQLENALLLYDEPDTSLHPSGAKQLRDELLRLAERNLVVYSTHSIFMVDSECLERHIIVRREAEVTLTQRAKPCNVRDEEVLYNAIGHSIFDIIGEKNLVLEGHRDKLLLECVLLSDVDLGAKLQGVGRCHAGGVKNVAKITSLLQLAARRCLIVSDGDRPALDARKEYEGHAKWVTYSELAGPQFVTAEDFLSRDFVLKVLERLAAAATVELVDLVNRRLRDGDPLMKQIHDALASQSVPKDRRGEVLNIVKSALFEKLAPDDIAPAAKSLVVEISKLLDEVG